MKIRPLLIAASLLLVASAPVLVGCGGGSDEGARSVDSASGGAQGSGRPSVEELSKAIAKNAPGVLPEGAACVAKALLRSELSDAYFTAALHPEKSLQLSAADSSTLMTVMGPIQSECKIGSPQVQGQ